MTPSPPLRDAPLEFPADDPARHGLHRRRFGLQFGLVVVLVAAAIGLLLPTASVTELMHETGPVETATLWAYLAAVLAMLAFGRSVLPASELAACCVLLAAMAAREADLHTALFGISILKSHFYLHAPLHQILVALAVLAPIVLSGLWLAWRHWPRWRHAPARWTPAMVTLTTMVAVMVFAKIMDRTPATLGEHGLLAATPPRLIALMLSLEEVLELALPLFAIIAVLQGRLRQTRVMSRM